VFDLRHADLTGVEIVETAEEPGSERRRQIWIGRIEAALGFSLLACSGLLSVLSDGDPVIELKGLLVLSPFFFGIAGTLLVLAGANVLTNSRYPFLMHVPLIGWLLVILLALM
jgi:hypothetical protein